MNKYLLLRDNKQTGPYTVPEIIAMGIKPYDLVWLEGKSAAWRYPSEVEELRDYAPAVEEQPFDRFYKKPETVSKTVVATTADHERYEPKIIAAEQLTQKKVYINFPGSLPDNRKTAHAPAAGNDAPVVKKSVSMMEQAESSTTLSSAMPQQSIEQHTPVQQTKSFAAETKKTSVPLFPERTVQQLYADDNALRGNHDPVHHLPVTKKNDKKLLYGVIAACFFLVVFAAVLLLNYNRQQKDLHKLNDIVQQMENREKAQLAPIPATHTQPAPVTEPVTDPAIDPNVNDYNAALTDEPSVVSKPAVTKTVSEVPKKNQDDAPVSFRENKTPVNTTPPVQDEQPATDVKQNLFELVSVKPNAFKTGLLGGISNLKFELSNNSESALHRVAVVVKYFGPEKKLVNEQTVFFENVSPGARQTVSVPKSNRGVSIEYVVTDIKSQPVN